LAVSVVLRAVTGRRTIEKQNGYTGICTTLTHCKQ
jgi:hypothetical protein